MICWKLQWTQNLRINHYLVHCHSRESRLNWLHVFGSTLWWSRESSTTPLKGTVATLRVPIELRKTILPWFHGQRLLCQSIGYTSMHTYAYLSSIKHRMSRCCHAHLSPNRRFPPRQPMMTSRTHLWMAWVWTFEASSRMAWSCTRRLATAASPGDSPAPKGAQLSETCCRNKCYALMQLESLEALSIS